MFLASERNKGLGWKWSGLKIEWTGNLEWSGLAMEWSGLEKRTKVNWEDEWIMIPPTPLEPPVACDDWPYFFIEFY